MDNKDGSKPTPTGALGGSTPQANDGPEGPRRQYPDTLRGRPSAAPNEPGAGTQAQTGSNPPFGEWPSEEEPAERPSVQSLPPPLPVGQLDDRAAVRSEAAVSSRPAAAAISGASSPAPSTPVGPRFVLDRQALWGIGLVGLMALIGFGGWWFTGRTYRDAGPTPPPAPAAPAVTAKAAVTPAPPTPPAAEADTKPAPGTSPAHPASTRPVLDVPSREDIRDAFATLQAAFGDCAHGRKGTAKLELTLASSGHVTQAVVGGDFAGAPEAACIARVARTAQVARFKKPRFHTTHALLL